MGGETTTLNSETIKDFSQAGFYLCVRLPTLQTETSVVLQPWSA